MARPVVDLTRDGTAASPHPRAAAAATVDRPVGPGNRALSSQLQPPRPVIVSREPAAASAAPAAGVGAGICSPEQQAIVAADVAQAVAIVRDAIAIGSSPSDSADGDAYATGQEMVFHRGGRAMKRRVQQRLRWILDDLLAAEANTEWRCRQILGPLLSDPADPGVTKRAGATATPGLIRKPWRRGRPGTAEMSYPADEPLNLFPGYFELPGPARAVLLIHESAHRIGIRGDVYTWMVEFDDLPPWRAINNADSIAGFAYWLARWSEAARSGPGAPVADDASASPSASTSAESADRQ